VTVTNARFNSHQSLQEFRCRISKKAQLRHKHYSPWRLRHSSRYSNSLWPRSHGVEYLMWENVSVRRTCPHRPRFPLIRLQRILGLLLGIRRPERSVEHPPQSSGAKPLLPLCALTGCYRQNFPLCVIPYSHK